MKLFPWNSSFRMFLKLLQAGFLNSNILYVSSKYDFADVVHLWFSKLYHVYLLLQKITVGIVVCISVTICILDFTLHVPKTLK